MFAASSSTQFARSEMYQHSAVSAAGSSDGADSLDAVGDSSIDATLVDGMTVISLGPAPLTGASSSGPAPLGCDNLQLAIAGIKRSADEYCIQGL